MSKFLVILVCALLFEAVGVVFLSRGLKQIGEAKEINVTEIARLIQRGITNRSIILGVALEAVFFGGLLYLLSRAEVSLIWPLTSLGFVLTTLSAKLVLHEQVTTTRWAGVCLIVMGAGLITWSEKSKVGGAPPLAASRQVETGR
ncbi:MAG TPA: EamA family transporter [Verrucomicrobiae bacterium]|nr:EamA family transporter [Verrucomicrobiae bacterium]